MSALVLALFAPAWIAQAPARDEAAHYAVDYLTPPDGAVLEVGGMDFLPDGRLAVSTRRGQVWLIEDALAEDPAAARFTLFAEGLQEGLGLKVVDGKIHVVQRGELSRLSDEDGDGVCDRIDTISNGWGLSGNYHEFAYGLPVDDTGNFYVTLNVSFFSPKWWHGKSPAPYRGWMLRISPTGEVTPFACGFRSPCGVARDPAGRILVTDNQGDWMPASPIFLVEEGGFYGHPASLDWTPEYRASQTHASDTIPPARAADTSSAGRRPAAIWLPYKWSRSPGNMTWDETGGKFGPFQGQFFLAELTNGMILRGDTEEVNGGLQGWVVPFRQRVGSAVRVAFAPDGTLLAGFTNRGWGGYPPADGIGRIRYTGEPPFEIQSVHLLRDEKSEDSELQPWIDVPTFQVRFTQIPSPSCVPRAIVEEYDYDYWWEYGSPERDTTRIEADVFRAGSHSGFDTLYVRVPDLEPGRVARVRLLDVTSGSGAALLHDEFAYTVNQLPGGTPSAEQVAKIVPPPPARESDEEGWLRLTYGDATNLWHFEGWRLCDAELDPDDPTRFKVIEGVNALTNTASAQPSNYVSKPVFGDAEIHVDFMLPEKGRAGVMVMGRYEILLADGTDDGELTAEHCGAIRGGTRADGSRFDGIPPRLFAYRGPGLLHEMDVDFRAPRFDEEGNKVANARILRVRIDDVLVQENVEVPGPSDGSEYPGEVAEAPLVLRGDAGEVAFGNVRVLPVVEGEPVREEGWESLLDFSAEDPLAGWHASEDGIWYVEDDVLIGEGPRSHLFSPRGDYTDFEVRARLKISDGGNSGLFLRAQEVDEGWPPGYEAWINSSFADPHKTGSLSDGAPISTQLIAPDTWFDYDVTCRDEPAGTHLTVRVNGVVVNDYVDAGRTYARGHVALQQHHDGSVIEVQSLEIRTLP